MMLRLVNH